MTTEEKAKAYDEALEKFKKFKEKYCTYGRMGFGDVICDKTGTAQDELDAIFPELKESEDERIRKRLLWFLANYTGRWDYPETRMACRAWLEKQEEASKAIEAIDRIDKYIDVHLANAHDMKDSNPDKKYYRGWDDALGKMAGILQDVYSVEKKEESLRDFIDNFPYSDEQKEQKPISQEDEDKKLIDDVINSLCCYQNTLSDYQKEIVGEEIRKLKSLSPQPKQKWSEDDEHILKGIIGKIDHDQTYGVAKVEMLSFLKSLRPQWHPSEEQMKALQCAITFMEIRKASDYDISPLKELYEQLKKLKEDKI